MVFTKRVLLASYNFKPSGFSLTVTIILVIQMLDHTMYQVLDKVVSYHVKNVSPYIDEKLNCPLPKIPGLSK